MGNIAGIDHVQLALPVRPEELGATLTRLESVATRLRASLFDPFGNRLGIAS